MSRRSTLAALSVALASLAGFSIAPPAAAAPPEIRISATNRVPACVTPARLDAFIRTRNSAPEARFAGIGAWYKQHGDAWRVRWDYAFYQMVLETNYLMFRRGDGKPGDVSSRQNNFAGIGATGGGVPGDSYRDVSTGVLAQIQHLVAYSGELVDKPVAPRTQLKQEDIVSASRALRRPVTFADLRNRWAADRNYARSIETIAERFHEQFCSATGAQEASAAPRPAVRPPTAVVEKAGEAPLAVPVPQQVSRPTRRIAIAAAPGTLAVPQGEPIGSACRILAASYGGSKTMLIQAAVGDATEFTALTVTDGFERSMLDSYLKSRAPGGRAIGEFASRDAAMAKARALCPAAS